LLADILLPVRRLAEEAVMAQMIDTLKAAVEAEKAKLLAELSKAAEPRLSAIRREIAACDSLLVRLARSRAA
jgi:division protein CdvB (Snf7/Vps24/ESCRT-III family)